MVTPYATGLTSLFRWSMRVLVSNLSVPRYHAEPRQRAALEQAAKDIERAFRAGGLDPLSDAFLARGFVTRNIEVEVKGASPQLFVIGAHYDSVRGTPAAGVAVLTELATLLSRGGVTPRQTLRLVAFSNEEPPYLGTEEMGSRVYARRCKGRGEELAGMISLDLSGLQSTRPLKVLGNFKSRGLAKRVAKVLEPIGPVKRSSLGFLPGRKASGHASFWQEGWPAVMLTDGGKGKCPADTAVDFQRLERIAQALVELVR